MPIFSTSELGPPPAWRKVLWLRQPYPDNYTGEEFLDALVINADVVERGYWRVVRASLAVDLQLSAAAIVGSTAYKMHTGSLQAERVLAAAAALLLVGSLMQTVAAPAKVLKPGPASAGKRRWLWIQAAARRVVRSLASALLLLAVAAALSPVYATLTESISTDTVIACTCALLIAHLYLHDYSHSAAHASGRLSGSLGLTCALCASVLMASQLDAWQQVFALVVLSLELYIMLPHVHHCLSQAVPLGDTLLPLCCTAAALALVSQTSVLLTSVLLCALAFITLLCPMWMVRIHKFKAQINGPWDEAVPRLSTQLSTGG